MMCLRKIYCIHLILLCDLIVRYKLLLISPISHFISRFIF
jgi:hypothetical protein